jgi:nicotinate-nucleotide pyrophosphorylase (carboxylating)
MDPRLQTFFQGKALDFMLRAVELALEEDGQDLTSQALFTPGDRLEARITAKEPCVIAGLPLMNLILKQCASGDGEVELHPLYTDGDRVQKGANIATLSGPALVILKAERVMLNLLAHLSGIATLTSQFVSLLGSSRTKLLDTRKTLPGLRYPDKYAVRVGGGHNHRLNLSEMIMLKDNHIDRAGSISAAVTAIRNRVAPCPPIEVECRNDKEVQEAVESRVDRIMLDNMEPDQIARALKLIPDGIETEISGGINAANISRFARLGADFISVGSLTNSARSVDLSLTLV